MPQGISLTILPGTVIKISPSDSTKTDPEYLSSLTEITVRGTLRAEGKGEAPITFILDKGGPGDWAGIIVDGGAVILNSCEIQGAEAGLYVREGSATLLNSLLMKNRYGVVLEGRNALVRIENTKVKENDYGVLLMRGATIDITDSSVFGNRKKDVHSSKETDVMLPLRVLKEVEKKEKNRIYADAVLRGNTVWQGRIAVQGRIRVPEDSRLVIMPGTVVEFRKKDTNQDGIGENGLMIQGVIIAKGTGENPIIFRSAESQKRIGDWDAINIMNSDGVQNIIEYCQVEDAYRGLHFHFSNVAVRASVLRNNYRAVQFQESMVDIAGTHIYENNSGMQARDSAISMTDNFIFNNYSGVNLFRDRVVLRGNKIVNNYREGLRIREGVSDIQENLIDMNRYGLMVSDSLYGSFSRNVISRNIESGISLKGTDNMEISGNYIFGNGFNGMNIQDSRAVIRGNHIAENGQRGIGIISFNGTISDNNISANGLYAIDLEGSMDVSAPMNWWGTAPLSEALYDKNDEPERGRVDHRMQRQGPILFPWPLKTIITDTTWEGNISIQDKVHVLAGATLELKPDTRILFSPGTGLRINGRIRALGRKDARIIFTSSEKKEVSGWDEILLEYAMDSVFSNCDFEYATWGIHSHFTNLIVKACRFRNNYGGLRFRSGPVEIVQSVFEENHIGIRAYRGNALIKRNSIARNDIGIFVREKGGGLNIRENNLFSNTGYNIRVGDFNYENVDAANNFWGDSPPLDSIFDEKTEPGIGMVIYEPYALKPFVLDTPSFMSGKESEQEGVMGN
ncbi:MAG: right-handed parallel beta-helix repeat-containing protein [Thermodesulfovibrionales bacterium]